MEAGAARYLAAVHARWLDEEPQTRWREVDATLLFADVSGFTALGERLARSGRVGTEELTDVIKAVFARMLEPVLALGGDLLKFGGDAVLLLFEGDDHAERAAAGALAMQEAIRSLRGMRTSAGAVSLRLSAGLASGPLHLFLAGSSFKDLVVAGPLSSAVCDLEGAAGPGEVLIGARTAAARGVRRRPTDGRPGVPIRTAAPVDAAAPTVAALLADPAAGLPPHLRDREPGDGEHRMVTAAFVQFRGPDSLLAEAGPVAVADALDELTAAVQEACAVHDVTLVAIDVDRDAGKFYLVTGAPTAGTDDEDRMLHAVSSVVRRGWSLPVRGGVNRGRAFVVDVGTRERVCWSVMGDTINLAARVMGKAPVGGVLATPEVLDRARDEFERTPVEPFMAKGKRLPVHAELVGAASAARRPAIATAGELFGRDHELGVLREALGRARLGAREAVQLTGEPGIGKTRLLDAALAEADEFQVVRIHGGPYSAASPYLAVRAPLRELLGVEPTEGDAQVAAVLRDLVLGVDPGLLDWLPLIALPFGVELPPTPETSRLSPEFARARLQSAVTALLDGLDATEPLLVTVEDANWLDEPSADLLAHLHRRSRRSHRLIIVTRRAGPHGLDLEGAERVTLLAVEPLGGAAAQALLASDGLALTPRMRQELIERSAGNPLFLQELVAAARAAGGDLTELPDSVEALITARIDTLSPADRAMLRQAAVLGVRVDTAVLGELLGLEAGAVDAALARLEDFLQRSGDHAARFRHALAREAAYEALPFRVRRQLHARAGELIEARATHPDDVAELLAQHFHAAGRWPASWRWSRAAGEQATRQSAPVEAVAFLTAALDAGRKLVDVPEIELSVVAEELGDAANLAARYEAAAAAYREARRRAPDEPLRLAELYRKEGRLRERSLAYPQAKRWYTRASSVLAPLKGPEARALRARVACFRAAADLRQGRLRASIPLLEEAVEGAEAAGDRATLAHAYYLMDWALTDAGSPDARRYRDLALPIYEELGDRLGQGNVLNNLGVAAYYEGDWEAAVRLYERSREAFERGGDVVQVASALNNIAEIRSDQGRFDEAEQGLREAMDIWRAANFPAGSGWALSNLGRVAARRGDLERARELLAEARGVLATVGAEALALEVDAREAERRLFAGDHEGALILADGVHLAAERLGAGAALSAMLHRIAGAARVQAGDVELGRVRLEEAASFARSVGAPYEEALALEALAATGGPDAEQQARDAERAFSALGVRR